VICSSRLHSRSIDSIGGARPLVPCGGGKPGSFFEGQGVKRRLQVRLASQTTRSLAGGSDVGWGEPGREWRDAGKGALSTVNVVETGFHAEMGDG
jgi:hypothetical protein